MPPLRTVPVKKSAGSSENENSLVTKTVNTRSSKTVPSVKKENPKAIGPFSKRKASPIKGNTLKRSALGNITNAIETKCIIDSGKKTAKKTVSSTVTKPTLTSAAKISLPVSTLTKPVTAAHVPKPSLPPLPKSRLTLPLRPAKTSVQSRPSVSSINLKTVTTKAGAVEKIVPSKPVTRQSPTVDKKTAPTNVVGNKCRVLAKPKGTAHKDPLPHMRRSTGRRSTLESNDSSLYISALSDVLDEDVTPTTLDSNESHVETEPLPAPLINIDIEYLEDPFQCAAYAHDIFEYLKTREGRFEIDDYMSNQVHLNSHCRAILVDWMVEIQENFELNHETLYLAVKLVDAYLSKIRVAKNCLQLVGSTALLIAAKYDERMPPAIEDFLYICDGSYKRKDILKMEVNILRVIDFELGFPLSYRFLRRYARCAKVPMPLLTMARFILEFSLMDYSIVRLSDSKLAAAALYLAFKMRQEQEWDDTLIHFSGYRVKDFIDIVYILNNILHQKPRQSLSTVRNKYSHKIFFEVAKTPLLSNEDL